METRAIVILYCGTEPSEYVLSRIVGEVANCAQNNTVSVNTLDSEDIAKTVLSTFKVGDNEQVVDSPYTEEENAAIYIGAQIEKWTAYPLYEFTAQLSVHVTTLKFTHADDKFLKAIQILAAKDVLIIRRSIRKKYGLKDHIIEAIRRIGRNV